jgi:dTDP-4-amino-4,6-dideoxygalactose transaminase
MLYLSPPHLHSNEEKYLQEVLVSNWIAPVGEFLDKFETAIGNYIKTKYLLATNSGTSALHLALLAANIKKNDIVLVSSFTFVASANPILYMGAIPVFIDSEKESWNICPKMIEKAIQTLKAQNKKPKALIITHLYGQAANLSAIQKITKENDIILIEDAAESLGCTWNHQFVGTFGEYGFFSFNGNKIITTSAGGMLVVKSEEVRKKTLFLATQAKDDAPHYQHTTIGYNYRLSNVLAALGYGQVENLGWKIEKKRQIFNFYKQHLENNFELMPELPQSNGTRWLSCILCKNESQREILRLKLLENKIETRPLWKPLHLQPLFKDFLFFGENISQHLFKRGLCLPSGTQITEEQQMEVIRLLNS